MGSASREKKLLKRLVTGSRASRLVAARTMGRQGTMATIPSLLELTRDHPPEEVQEGPYVAIRLILGRYPVPEMCRHINDQRLPREVRLALLREVKARGDRRAVKLLLPVLPGAEKEVRYRVAHLLGSLGDGTLVGSLTKLLENGDPSVRESAALALGMLGSPKAILALIPLIADVDTAAAHTATMALGLIARETGTQSREIWYEEVRGREPLVWLIAACGHKEAAVRAMGCFALAELGIDRETVVEAVTERLRDEDDAVRRWAAYACGALRAEATAPKLRELGRDPRSAVRAAAIHALGVLSDRESVPLALSLLTDRNDRVRNEAEATLSSITYHVYEREGQKPQPPVVHWRAWWQENGQAGRHEWLQQRVSQEIEALESPAPLRRKRAMDFLYEKTRQRHEYQADAPREKRLDAARSWRVWWARSQERHPVEWLIEALRSHDKHRRQAAYLDLKRVTKGLFVYDAYAPASRRQEGIRNIEAWWTKNKKMFMGQDRPV
jgi:HEAT repeat protein